MSSNSPLVSIGMPIYNADRYLRLALDSLLAQDYEHFELVISDNASTDDTSAICRDYAARDPRIGYSRNENTLDMMTNYNLPLTRAQGKYFMWAAHDDLWEPDFISSLVPLLERDPGAILAFGRLDTIDVDGRPAGVVRVDWPRIFAGSRFWQFAQLALREESSRKAEHIYGLMRREVLLACGGMARSASIYTGEDMITLLRLLSRGRFAVIDRLLFHYRVRSPGTRQNQSVLAYAWQRLARTSAGHRSSLMLFLYRNHIYHADMRRVLVKDTPLSAYEKAALWLALVLRELWLPIAVAPRAALRELRLLPGQPLSLTPPPLAR